MRSNPAANRPKRLRNPTILIEERIASVRTLDDAYELAHEFENSEVNRLFSFLAIRFMDPRDRAAFVVREILDHQAKLMEFAEAWGNRAWRRSIRAAELAIIRRGQ